MTDDEQESADRFIKAFREQLHHVDDFITVVLNGHLEIEGELDSYLKRIFTHPKPLQEARLSFYQKVCIARAYTPLSYDRYEWPMMTLLNSIRNKVAHRSRHEVLEVDVSQIRRLLEGVTSKKFQDDLRAADDKEVMVYAAALGSGFLSIMEEQLAAHRGEEVDEER